MNLQVIMLSTISQTEKYILQYEFCESNVQQGDYSK